MLFFFLPSFLPSYLPPTLLPFLSFFFSFCMSFLLSWPPFLNPLQSCCITNGNHTDHRIMLIPSGNYQPHFPPRVTFSSYGFLRLKKKKNDNANRISCPEKGVLQSLTYKCWDSFCTHLQRITHAFKYPGTKNPTNGSCASSHFSALDSLARTGHLRVALSPSIFQTKRTYISFLHTMNLEKQKLLQRVSKLIQQAVNEPF